MKPPRAARRAAAPVAVLAVLAMIVLPILLLGCALEPPASMESDSAEESMARSAPEAEPAPADGGSGVKAVPNAAATRKLIKTVHFQLRVDDTKAAAEELQRLTDRLGGFVGSLSADRRDDGVYYSLTLRVPVERLEDALVEIRALAEEVDQESISAQDVTDQYVDLEARLRTLRGTETELQGILSEARERDYDAEEVMAVYRQLTEIRTNIEQIQGQLQVLTDRTALSTIDVRLSPTESSRPVVEERWRPGETAKRAFRGLLEALRGLVDLAIVLVIAVLPVLLLVAIPLWLLIRWWRGRRPRRPPEEPTV
jgi:chromosome segregation ATPase